MLAGDWEEWIREDGLRARAWGPVAWCLAWSSGSLSAPLGPQPASCPRPPRPPPHCGPSDDGDPYSPLTPFLPRPAAPTPANSAVSVATMMATVATTTRSRMADQHKMRRSWVTAGRPRRMRTRREDLPAPHSALLLLCPFEEPRTLTGITPVLPSLYAPTPVFLLDLAPCKVHCHHVRPTLTISGPRAILSSPASCLRARFSHLLAFRCCPLGGVESGETARAGRGWRRASVLKVCGGESLPGARRTRRLSHLAILT